MIAQVISLGCPKNLIDSEIILGHLVKSGFILTDSIQNADLVIINTCAFIKPAVDEAKDKIREILAYKNKGFIQKIFVVGCLVQRYKQALEKEFPEVDGFLGIDYLNIIPKVASSKTRKRTYVRTPYTLCSSSEPRLLSTPKHYAYLKIADGCDNRCSYCLLPSIRGRFRSREIEDIEQEARMLANSGVKELILVAQDTTLYGQDLYPESARGGLAQLLRRLNRIKSIIWIRLLYTHPAHFTDDLIEMIAKLPRVAKYIDLPLQHISDRILKQMNRKVKRQDIERLLERLRKIEGLTLRTSFIVGFPSETDKDFSELLDFVRQSALGGFDHLGCFTYCREKGSPAYRLRNQVSEKVKIERFNEIMKLQKNISRKRLKNLIGKKVNVLIDTHLFPSQTVGGGQEGGYDYIGRTEENAPEIDGLVYLKGKNLNPGDYVTVKVIMTSDYDLFAVKD